MNRPRSRAPLLAVVALALGRAASAQQAPATGTPVTDAGAAARALIERCAGELDAKTSGLAALEAACPGLEEALTSSGLRASLIEGAAERVDAESLRALHGATRGAARATPDAARLAGIASSMRGTPDSVSLWQRFKTWFQQTFLSRAADRSSPWLEEWLRRLQPGERLRDLLVWGLLLVVVGSTLYVLVRELRASDLRWAALLRRRVSSPATASGDAALPIDEDWRRVDLLQRPAALFRQVARRLSADGRLPASGSQTHRELAERARLEAPEEQRAWAALARAAERQIYAPRGVTVEEAQRVVEDAARHWAGPT